MALAIGSEGFVPNFRCSNCGAVHPFTEANNAALHASASIAHFAWYRQDDGLNINATICLKCGTVHATAFGIGKALFSFGRRVWSVQYYLPPDRLLPLIREHGNPLPQEATDLLLDRGFIPMPSDAEGVELIHKALFVLGMFCEVVRNARFDGDSVEAFLRVAEERRHKERLWGSAAVLGGLLDGKSTAPDIAEMAYDHYYRLTEAGAQETTIKLDITHAFSMYIFYCNMRRDGAVDLHSLEAFLKDARMPAPNDNPSGMEAAADNLEGFLDMFATPDDIVREARARRDAAIE